MGEVVNLRQARKRKARANKEVKAEENRQKFGQKKADKNLREALDQHAEKKLDQGKLDKPIGAPEADEPKT